MGLGRSKSESVWGWEHSDIRMGVGVMWEEQRLRGLLAIKGQNAKCRHSSIF